MKQFPTASDFNDNTFENKSKVKSDNPEQNLKQMYSELEQR